MPLPLILAGVGAVLLAVVGVSVFSWRVYVKAGVGPGSVEVGVGGPSSGVPGAVGGGVPWIPIALAAAAAYLIAREL